MQRVTSRRGKCPRSATDQVRALLKNDSTRPEMMGEEKVSHRSPVFITTA